MAETTERAAADVGLGLGMVSILEQLNEHGPQTAPELARGLLVSRQSAQQLIDPMLTMGLLERIKNPMHARSWVIQTTKKGIKVFNKIEKQRELMLSELIQDLNRDSVRTCAQVISQISMHYALRRQLKA